MENGENGGEMVSASRFLVFKLMENTMNRLNWTKFVAAVVFAVSIGVV